MIASNSSRALRAADGSSLAWKKPALLVLIAAAVSALYLYLDSRFVYLLVYGWFGIIYGIFLQYGRFCMASAVRDLFAIGVPRMAVGVLIAVVLYAVISAFVQEAGVNTFHPHPLGWHVLIGGALFGLGMVVAGGCASSTLYKTGEGNLGSILVLFSISFSQAWLVSTDWFSSWVPQAWAVATEAETGLLADEIALTSNWFDQFTVGYLWKLTGTTATEYLGLPANLLGYLVGNTFLVAVLPTIILLALLYRYNYRKMYVRQHPTSSASFMYELRGVWSMIIQSKNTAIAGIGLAVFAGLQMFVTGELREYYNIFNFGELLAEMGYENGLSIQDTVFDPGYWYITTQEAQWAGWVMEKIGMDMHNNIFFGVENGLPNPLLNAPGMMSVGIIIGAAMIAIARKEFKWKLPNLETAILAVAGGILMGFGARIGMGCNIGAFFATVTNGDVSGWVFLFGMTVGGYLSVKALKAWIDWRLAKADFDF